MEQHQQTIEASITFFQWVTLGLGVAGFFLTWTGMVISITRAVGSIKESTDTKIAEETDKLTDHVNVETDKITSRLNDLASQFEDDQRTQDNRFGETALSIRQYVATVEKEMHSIEIWGRDNFVLKTDFIDTLRRIEGTISQLSTEMKDNFKTMLSKMDDINGNSNR